MRKLTVCLSALVLGLAPARAGLAQKLALRAASQPRGLMVATSAETTAATVSARDRTPELLILMVGAPGLADRATQRRLADILFSRSNAAWSVRLGIFHGSQLEIGGPFRSAAEFQTVLRKTWDDAQAIAVQPDDAMRFADELTAALEPLPSDWGYTLIVGRMPEFPSAEVAQYAALRLTRAFTKQKRSLLFRDPAGLPAPQWAETLARDTGGGICREWSDLADYLADGTQPFVIDWEERPYTRGFEIENAILSGSGDFPPLTIPDVRAPASLALPPVAEYAELRRLTADMAARGGASGWPETERALAINPADRDAVRLGLDLALKDKSPDKELSLLSMALELAPGDARLSIRMGDLQYSFNRFEEAEKSLVQGHQGGEASPKTAEELARIRIAAGDYAHALPWLEESLALNPGQQALWFLAADGAKRLGDTAKQAAALEKGLALGGQHIDLRRELIEIDLGRGDLTAAARNADAELRRLPSDADTQTVWAGFYEKLGRTDDALACWRRAVKANPAREPAQFAVVNILLERKSYSEVADAAGAALKIVSSPRLQVAKSTALERLDRIYEARRFIAAAASKSQDPDLLQHAAKVAEVYGGDAPLAWRRFASALASAGSTDPARHKAEMRQALEHGLRVAARDGDAKTQGWFEEKLAASAAEKSSAPAASRPEGVWIPGGAAALMFAARGDEGVEPGRLMAEYARTVLSHQRGPSREAEAYEHEMLGYFEQLGKLLALCTRSGDHSLVTLSVTDKRFQRQTDAVLDLLGWRLKRTRQSLSLEAVVSTGAGRRQDLASALAVDQVAVEKAFQKGEAYTLTIPWEWAPMRIDDATLKLNFQIGKYAGGLPEAMVRDAALTKIYVALNGMDSDTLAAINSVLSLQTMAVSYADRLSFYASALSVVRGRVVTPGGPEADSVWVAMCGASPATPGPFLHALLAKDDGRLLAWFFTLSQLDFDHQRFFTLNVSRSKKFYELFGHAPEARTTLTGLQHSDSFTEFMREVPLTDGSVDFPGGPEVWLVAKGQSHSAAATQSLLKKAHKAVAPDVEDEILLRLAGARYNDRAEQISELDNFVAAVRIDRAREESLDDESALMLAQNYGAFRNFYPYFTSFTSLTAKDYRAFFDFADKLKSINPVDADLILGQFDSLVELLHSGVVSGGIGKAKAEAFFRQICAGFGSAPDLAGATRVSLDTVRELAAAVPAGGANPDRVIAQLALGTLPPADFESEGTDRSIDVEKKRREAYARVLEMQRVTPLEPLLNIDAAARKLAAGNTPVAALIDGIQKNGQALLWTQISKQEKSTGRVKESFERLAASAKFSATVAGMREKTAKKKVNPHDLASLYQELFTELAPQVRLALSGPVYAAFLSPDDILVANDPLLVRKHRFLPLNQPHPERDLFGHSELNVSTDDQGSFFIGGFAQFADAAGAAAAIGGHAGGASSVYFAKQIAAIRATPWSRFGDRDQRMLGLRLRIAREWCVVAAGNTAMYDAIAQDSFGILSLGRRRDLLSGIQSHDWNRVWQAVTLSDLYFLSARYLARYSSSPWNSPVDAALRVAGTDDRNLRLLGPLLSSLEGYASPDLVALAPYEGFERHLFLTDVAERTAEMKLYLAESLDRMALPATLLPAIAEPVARRVFAGARASDDRDWTAVIRAFQAIGDSEIGGALHP